MTALLLTSHPARRAMVIEHSTYPHALVAMLVDRLPPEWHSGRVFFSPARIYLLQRLAGPSQGQSLILTRCFAERLLSERFVKGGVVEVPGIVQRRCFWVDDQPKGEQNFIAKPDVALGASVNRLWHLAGLDAGPQRRR